jgi:hypothetical protein
LTEEDLARAKQLVVEEKVKGQVIEWRDKSCKGLVLRITPTATHWYLRFREVSIRLEPWMDVEYARKVADMTKTARRTGGDPKRFLANFLESRGHMTRKKMLTNNKMPMTSRCTMKT